MRKFSDIFMDLTGHVGDIGGIMNVISTVFGRKEVGTVHGKDEGVKAEVTGKGVEDEYLFFAALGHYLEENGVRVIDGKVTREHIKTFNQICLRLKAEGRNGAAKMLRRIVGIKETTIATKKVVGKRRRKDVEEDIVEEEKDELNIKGARILLTLHAIGIDGVMEIIESTGVLDNPEDTVTRGVKAGKEKLDELLQKGRRPIEEAAAYYILGSKKYMRVMLSPSIQNTLNRLEISTDPQEQEVLLNEYLDELHRRVAAHVEGIPIPTLFSPPEEKEGGLPKRKITLILLLLLAGAIIFNVTMYYWR